MRSQDVDVCGFVLLSVFVPRLLPLDCLWCQHSYPVCYPVGIHVDARVRTLLVPALMPMLVPCLYDFVVPNFCPVTPGTFTPYFQPVTRCVARPIDRPYPVKSLTSPSSCRTVGPSKVSRVRSLNRLAV